MAERFWSFPAEAENGKTIIVTGRDNIEKFQQSGKYTSRIDVTWEYDAQPDGMPNAEDATLMGVATDAFHDTFRKDKCAVLTGIYTGDGKRDWIFYCKNLKAFSSAFNRALEQLPRLPLLIEAADDPDWEEYHEMRNATYIPKDTEE